MKVLALILALLPGAAHAACRLALVLALDVSGSVDEREYLLQMNGIATALEDPAVRGALLALPDARVRLAIFEWSSSRYQREVLGWTELASPADIDRIVAHLKAWRRAPGPEATALGAAMARSGELLSAQPGCWKRVADISGDGKNNDWPLPRDVKESGQLGDITVNALVIGVGTPRIADERQAEITELSSYFRTQVLYGPGAFLEVSLGFEDYARAMTRKLLREVEAPPLGQAPATGGDAPVKLAKLAGTGQ